MVWSPPGQQAEWSYDIFMALSDDSNHFPMHRELTKALHLRIVDTPYLKDGSAAILHPSGDSN